jgi:hypothetical protein
MNNIPVMDTFADVTSPKRPRRFDEFTEALNKSFSNPGSTPGVAPAPQVDAISTLQALATNKSFSPDVTEL